jgi:hypothetical protein
MFDWKAPDYDAVWAGCMARLEALRAEPGRWAPLCEFYTEHPVKFINDWGVTFDRAMPRARSRQRCS